MENDIVVIRTPSGISGDMLVTGLAKLLDNESKTLSRLIDSICLPELSNCLQLREEKYDGISGWKAIVDLPDEHHHRTYSDIRKIIESSQMTDKAKKLALDSFYRLAEAEGRVHLKDPDTVTFHEVGALDSIFDMCLASCLFDELAAKELYCSPLPVCDGTVQCAHGALSTPAPAVMNLLEGVPLYGLDSSGETVTPTAIALLKAFGAKFGNWPNVVVQKNVRVYGGRKLPNVPNGALFIKGGSYAMDDIN